jgi:hypothetical protein
MMEVNRRVSFQLAARITSGKKILVVHGGHYVLAFLEQGSIVKAKNHPDKEVINL